MMIDGRARVQEKCASGEKEDGFSMRFRLPLAILCGASLILFSACDLNNSSSSGDRQDGHELLVGQRGLDPSGELLVDPDEGALERDLTREAGLAFAVHLERLGQASSFLVLGAALGEGVA